MRTVTFAVSSPASELLSSELLSSELLSCSFLSRRGHVPSTLLCPSTRMASPCFIPLRFQLRLSSRDSQHSTKRARPTSSVWLWVFRSSCVHHRALNLGLSTRCKTPLFARGLLRHEGVHAFALTHTCWTGDLFLSSGFRFLDTSSCSSACSSRLRFAGPLHRPSMLLVEVSLFTPHSTR